MEDNLYGTETSDPSLPTIMEVAEYFGYLGALIIVDHGDGTWSAIDESNRYITMLDDTTFQIDDADALILIDTYEISSTNVGEQILGGEMATVTGLTARRMLEIEAASVVDGEIIGGNLILTKYDGTTINAGPLSLGPPGPEGPSCCSSIPGEIKVWPNSVLPVEVTYGIWFGQTVQSIHCRLSTCSWSYFISIGKQLMDSPILGQVSFEYLIFEVLLLLVLTLCLSAHVLIGWLVLLLLRLLLKLAKNYIL